MDNNLILDYPAFIRSIMRNKDTPHSFLLGAGASISSGIQSAGDCIWEWKKDIFLSENPNAPIFYQDIKSPSVRKGIQNWLEKEGIVPQLPHQSAYSYYAEKAYPIADDRRKYFQNLVTEKEPYIGYKLLCSLCKVDIVKAVWTTNFDGLFEKSAHRNNLTPISITLDSKDRIYRNQSKTEVLSVALHGDYKYSTLKNTDNELDAQEDEFIEALSRYHIDKNLIVIGFSGRDKSVMDALENAFSQKGTGRIYWCGYGDELNDNIRSLITRARDAGREAHYISTEGFDKTLLHLAKSCLENNNESQAMFEDLLSISEDNDYVNTNFTTPQEKIDKYVKSNLHPISLPEDVLKFDLNFGDERPWAYIKSRVKDFEISAVPFKGSVYSISTIPELRKAFSNIESEILRTPVSIKDVRNVTAFRSLMLSTVVKHLSKSDRFDSNKKDKIWIASHSKSQNINGQLIKIHRAIKLSLIVTKNKHYGFLSLVPTVYLSSEEEVTIEQKRDIGKESLEKLFNDKYDQYLDWWRKLLFKTERIEFEYPELSGSGFKFAISSQTTFGKVQVLDTNYRAYAPRKFDTRLIQHHGVQYLEPELLFRSNTSLNDVKDFHPMRALIKSKPWDFHLNGEIHTNEVRLSVICPSEHSDKFGKFLLELNTKQKAAHNPDYLLDYPGFSKAFNLPLNLPSVGSESWIDIIGQFNENVKESSLNLARSITTKILQLSNIHSGSIVVIFIPAEWHLYKTYDINGEKFDLHDYVKAYAASRSIATQFIEEKTLGNGLLCQTCWWLSLSFYVKSFRTPWILNTQESETAYAGIGYSVTGKKEETEVVVGCSHIYNSNGEGLKYKLSKVDDYYLDNKSNPFLSYEDAFQFGISISELFYSSMNSQPKRVVIHKRTRFTKDEVKGITDSLKRANIQEIDLIEINYESDARFLATKVFQGNMSIDGFPISRGTCMLLDTTSALLWTHGIVPSVRNPQYKYYLGGRSIPSPLKITKHYGRSNIGRIATEILGLTKMNWNSFDLYTKLPATINSSNQIAKIGKLLSRFEGKTYDYRFFI